MLNIYDESGLRPIGYVLNLDKKCDAVKILIDAQKELIQGAYGGENMLALNFMNTVNLPDGILNELLFDDYLKRLASDLKTKLFEYNLESGK